MNPNNKKIFAVRGNVFVGHVVSAKAPKTVTVERELVQFVPKYERYKKVRSKVKAHVPDAMSVGERDIVEIGETRKISKTKSFIVLRVVKKAEAKRLVEDVVVAQKKRKEDSDSLEAQS